MVRAAPLLMRRPSPGTVSWVQSLSNFYNVVATLWQLMCNVQRKYNVILQPCGHIALQRCHFTLWQRCWHIFFTMLLNQPSYNVVQRCIYVVCLLGLHICLLLCCVIFYVSIPISTSVLCYLYSAPMSTDVLYSFLCLYTYVYSCSVLSSMTLRLYLQLFCVIFTLHLCLHLFCVIFTLHLCLHLFCVIFTLHLYLQLFCVIFYDSTPISTVILSYLYSTPISTTVLCYLYFTPMSTAILCYLL